MLVVAVAPRRSLTGISMCTSSSTQLDPTEKDNLVRYRCAWLSKNTCRANREGAVLHFVTTSQCAHLSLISCTAVAKAANGPTRRSISISTRRSKGVQCQYPRLRFEATFESTPKGTHLRKASDKVRMPQWVQVLEERSKSCTRHLGVFQRPMSCRVGWPPKAADERTQRRSKPMRTMSVDDVVLTKLVNSSEVANSNKYFQKKWQLRYTRSAGSHSCDTKFKDHGLEDGTKTLVPLSAWRHLAVQLSDAGSSIDWADDTCQGHSLCGFVEGGRDDATNEKNA